MKPLLLTITGILTEGIVVSSMNGLTSEDRGCKYRKSRQLVHSQTSGTMLYDLPYAANDMENGQVINKALVDRNMPFSAAYSVPYRMLQIL